MNWITLRYHHFRIVLLMFLLIYCVSYNIYAQEKYFNNKDISNISSLPNIIKNLNEAQKKISSDLIQALNHSIIPNSSSFQTKIETIKKMKQMRTVNDNVSVNEVLSNTDVYVYIKFESGFSSEIINSFVTDITDVDDVNHLVVAWVPLANIEAIASLSGVKKISTVIPPIVNTGSVTTEGDGIHRTDIVRSSYAQSGAGIKVGIISDGVDHIADSKATGDLPNDVTVRSNALGGDEGTAMLEIVYDMAPSADLYFHDCGANTVAFNNAIADLIGQGCKVICDDISWITQPFFEDGEIASYLTSALTDIDIIYVSSAGNAGSSHYQGDFYSWPSPNESLHDFSRNGTDYFLYLNMPAGSSVRIVLEWNDEFGSSGNNYDLGLWSETYGNYVATSLNVQNGNNDPVEFIYYAAADSSAGVFDIVVQKTSGDAKTLEVFIYAAGGTGVYSNNITPIDAIYGHTAVPGALAVGAVRVTTPTSIESFSSQGPSTISYPSADIRSKPDIVGADGGLISGAGSFGSYNSENGEWRFYGTSASAPHVAAIAAQMWGAYPAKTGNEIRDAIKTNAVDLGDFGFDYVYGNGRADAMNSYDVLPVELISFKTESSGTDAKLLWSTATEINNYGFNVERRMQSTSTDEGTGWENIGFVKGSGNSNSTKKYSFVDNSIGASGKYSYRLKQIDFDGSFTYSNVIEINLIAPESFALVQNYPNPFNPSTVISYQLPVAGQVTLKIYDVLGREVTTLVNEKQNAGIYKLTWEPKNIASGTYFYRITSEKFTDVKKLLFIK